jgi:hypothetical protein
VRFPKTEYKRKNTNAAKAAKTTNSKTDPVIDPIRFPRKAQNPLSKPSALDLVLVWQTASAGKKAYSHNPFRSIATGTKGGPALDQFDGE